MQVLAKALETSSHVTHLNLQGSKIGIKGIKVGSLVWGSGFQHSTYSPAVARSTGNVRCSGEARNWNNSRTWGSFWRLIENIFKITTDEKNFAFLYLKYSEITKNQNYQKKINLNIKTLFKIKEKQNATAFLRFLTFRNVFMCVCVCFYVHVLCVFMVCFFVCSCLVLSFVIFSSIGFP